MSYKCFVIVRVKYSYRIYHIDIVTAFLYDFLNEINYVKQFYLFAIKLKKFYKLIITLYGLEQVSHIWYKTLIKFLKNLRFS